MMNWRKNISGRGNKCNAGMSLGVPIRNVSEPESGLWDIKTRNPREKLVETRICELVILDCV